MTDEVHDVSFKQNLDQTDFKTKTANSENAAFKHTRAEDSKFHTKSKIGLAMLLSIVDRGEL